MVKNPTKSESLNRKLISTARSIVTKQVSLPEGTIKLHANLYWLSLIEQYPLSDKAVSTINAYYSQIIDYPIGYERIQWNADVLQQQDQELQEITELYQVQLLKICNAILNLEASIG